MLNHLFKIILIYFSSFMLAYGETLSRVARIPASQAQNREKQEVLNSLQDYKKALIGHVDRSHCPPQKPAENSVEKVIDLSFFDLINTCRESTQEIEDHDSSGQQTCHPNIENGIKQGILPVMGERDEDKKDYLLTRDGREHLPQLRNYRSLKVMVQDYVFNNHIDSQERREVLYSYIENVIIPIREILLISMPDDLGELNSLYQGLWPQFPENLFAEYDHQAELELGPKPEKVPFFVKLKSLGNGRATIEFNNLKRLSVDIASLMESNTYHNYFRALRRSTLLMMLSQVQFYDAISGKESKVEIPRSCGSALNGNLPSELVHDYDQNREFGNTIVTNIIQDYRLAYTDEGSHLEEFYNSVQNVDIDPIYDAFGQITPFEELRNAEIALGHMSQGLGDEVKLDDITHYEKILSVLKQKVQSEYDKGDRYRYGYNRGQKVDREYIGLEVWKQITSVPGEDEVYSFEDDQGNSITFMPAWDNLSTYLANYLKRKKTGNIEEAISQNIRDELQSNSIRLDFPTLYGSPVWREWAISKVAHAFEDIANGEVSDTVKSVYEQFCQLNHHYRDNDPICARSLDNTVEGNLFAHLAERLAPFRNNNNYIPLDRLEELGMVELWPFFHALWVTEYFEESRRMNEYEFLMAQLYAGNPWARLRLGYLIAQEELKEQSNHYEVNYESRFFGLSRVPDKEGQCFNAAMIEEINKFRRIGRVTGLNKKLDLNYGETLLKNNEVESLWEGIKEEVDEKGKHLFTTKNPNQTPYYQVIDQINNYTIVDRQALANTNEKLNNLNLDDEAKAELEEIFSSERGLRGDFYMGLYRLRGKMDEQLEYYTSYLEDNGIVLNEDIKFEFVRLDNLVKNAVYKSLLREAAVKRRSMMLEQLDEVCQFAPDNHDELKTFFYMTAKAQNELNELTGLPAVPEDVMKRLEGWTSEDWWVIGGGVYAGVAGIGAFIAASACTASIVCGIIGAVALSAVVAQSSLFLYERRKFKESKIHVGRIKQMEELGLTDANSHKKMKHGWFMMAFELVSIFPMLGPSLRGFRLGDRMMRGLPVLKQSGLRGYKEYLVESHDMIEFDHAMTIAKRGLSDEDMARIGALEKEFGEQMDGVMTQHQSGIINRTTLMERMSNLHKGYMNKVREIGRRFLGGLGDEFATLSQTQVDEMIIRQLKDYHVSLENFSREFSRISGKRLDRAIARMEKDLEQASALGRWYIKLRSEHLYKYRDMIHKVQQNLDQAIAQNKTIDDFLRTNLDDLNYVYTKRPFEFKTLPHMLTGQGSTHSLEFGFARSEQVFGGLADSLLTKKIFQARDRLIYEYITKDAKIMIDLPEKVGSIKTYKVIRQLNNKVKELTSQLDRPGMMALQKPERTAILTHYQGLQEEASREAWKVLRANQKADGTYKLGRQTYQLNRETVKRVLFNPRTVEDEVLAERLWGAMDVDKVLGMDSLGDLAHITAKNLSNYNNVSEYLNFLSAAKVLVMKAKPELIDFI